jgi:hypothetical protein
METNIRKMRQVIQKVTLWTVATTETAKKRLTCQVSAAVQLQAAARVLLVRRRVWRVLDLQQIQTRTPSQFLQAVLCRAKVDTMTAQQHMLALQASEAVRLQAVTRGLLVRRRVGWLLDLQLIRPRTPSQFLQAIHRRTTTTAQLQAVLRLQWRHASS